MAEVAPPLELLPALHALLETESVTLAARRLHVGQPAMSRTLERLRAALRDELLVREGRKMARTRRGAELLPSVAQLLTSARQVFEPSGAFQPEAAKGVVTLALGDDMQALLSGALLERLRSKAPGLDVRVRPLTLESARDALRGAVELAVMPDLRAQYAIAGLDELVLSVQYTRRFVVVSRQRRALDLRAFVASQHILVSPQGEEGGYVDDALRLLGKRRRVAVTVPSFLAAISLVQSSALIATLPDDVVRVLAPRLHRQRCPVTTPELSMCIGWAARFNHDERHRWLREQVRVVLKQVVAVSGREGREIRSP